MPRSSLQRSVQRGFTIVELIVAISISALLAVYAQGKIARDMEDTLAASSAAYLAQIANAAQVHVLTNFVQYSSVPVGVVPGVGAPLTPSLLELRNLGRLTSGFPVTPGSMATRQTAGVFITRAPACPGPGCIITVLACTTTPVTLGGPDVRFDLASTMVSAQGNGQGAQQRYGTSTGPVAGRAKIIGPQNIVYDNPLGNVDGIVCGTSSVDPALFQQFLRQNETRAVMLNNGLTVTAGAAGIGLVVNGATTQLNNPLNVTGATTLANTLAVGANIKMDNATGRAGFGGTLPNDVPAGYAGVRSADMMASRNIVASTNPAAFTGTNGTYAKMTANNGAGVAEVSTSGAVKGNALVPTGSAAPGSACGGAGFEEGSIMRSTTGAGVVVCLAGAYRQLAMYNQPGDACAGANGSMSVSSGASSKMQLLCVGGFFVALDTLYVRSTAGSGCGASGTTAVDTTGAVNRTLVCRKGIYRLLADVTTSLSFADSYYVRHGDHVAFPVCGVGGTGLLQLIPDKAGTDDGVFMYSASTGGDWQVSMVQGNNVTPLKGNSSAIAQSYCYYP